MRELWEQAVLPYHLPLTIALGVVVVFWLVALAGAAGFDALDGDAGADGADGPPTATPMALLRLVNAADVPVTIVLSLLVLNLWVFSLWLNHSFNPEQDVSLGFAIVGAGFFGSVLATKLMTQPFVPLLRKLRVAGEAKPVVGQSGIVRSVSVTERYGQVEVTRDEGAPALLNCRRAAGCPDIPRGSEVIIISFDSSAGQYTVRPIASQPTDSPSQSPTRPS